MSSSKNYIQHVAVVGASGRSGRFMAEALLKTGKHTVTAITRADSKSQLPAGVNVKRISYDDKSSIVEALRGQDVLIITMSVFAPKDQESKLLEAAAEANVPWVFPNEWGNDYADEGVGKDTFIGEEKVRIRSLIEKLGKSSWIAVACGFWYEWSLAFPRAYGFDIPNRTVTFYDEGEQKICSSTWPQVGRAVASLLSLKVHSDGPDDKSVCLEHFKNRYVYISSFTVNQKDMLEPLLKVTKTTRDDWTITYQDVRERYAEGVKAFKTGDMNGFQTALYARLFYPDDSGNFEKTRGLDNQRLGLPEDDIEEATKVAVERAKTNPWA